MRSLFLSLALTLPLVACGSKTGLLIPDIAPDHIDATDSPDIVCVPDRIPLSRRTADVMFLIDRSSSMRFDLAGDEVPPSRWDVLHAALGRALPPVSSTLALGAAFFPQVVMDPNNATEACSTLSNVDITPARNNADRILSVFDQTRPGGGTPTFEGLRTVRNWFAGQPATRDPRYVVLATDGGPNCNGSLDPFSCVCTSVDPATHSPTCADNGGFAENCLDDRRTLTEMMRLVVDGVPVFVIGIDDPSRPELIDVLNRMAVVGGRPNMTGATRYYSVRNPADLDTAFQNIERTIAQCTFVTTRAPASFDSIHLLLDGTELPRDTTHTNGWDVTDRGEGEISIFGTECDRIANDPMPQLVVQLGCDDAGP